MKSLWSFLISTAALLSAPLSQAQYYGGDGADEFVEVVTCESIKGRTNYCGLSGYGGNVVLIEQLSRTNCQEGYNWGVDRRGVWVNQGCRATFGVVVPHRRNDRGLPAPGYGNPQPQAQAGFRCESFDGRDNYCALPFRGRVQLTNQLSRAECTEGYSWGVDRRGVWVSHGCRADFVVY
jgi:hypothetical protein